MRRAIVLLALAFLPAPALRAQRADALGVAARPLAAPRLTGPRLFGAGEDAFVLPRGEMRWTLSGRWTVHDELLDNAGRRIPLGTKFTADMGATSTGWLGVTQFAVRTALGDGSATVSAGQLRLREELHRTLMPLTIEVGLTSRVTVGLSVPVVFSFASAVVDLNRTSPSPANVALNPGRTSAVAAAAAASVLSQANAAVSALQGAFPSCFGPSPPPLCGTTINLAGSVAALGTGVSLGYGATGRFAPMAGGALHTQLLARFATLNMALRSALGLGADPLTARPTPAPVRMGLNDLNVLLLTPAFGVNADTLTSLERTALGDVEISARYLWANSFVPLARDTSRPAPSGVRWRSVAGVTVRLPTSPPPYLGQLLDPGAGDAATAIELRSTTDLAAGGSFWASVTGRYGSLLADRVKRRVPSAGSEVFPLANQVYEIDRKLGDYAELEITPRWMFNDYFAVSLDWLLFMRRGDRYTASLPVAIAMVAGVPAPVPDATLLNTSHQTAQRAGFGLTYSSLAARDRGKTGFPFDVRYQRLQTIAGEGTPFTTQDRLEFRLYTTLFGRR